MLEVVAHAEVQRDLPRQRPMVLEESTEVRNGKIDAGASERLPKLIGTARKKTLERTKQVDAGKTIRDIGAQPYSVYRPANLPEVFASRAAVRVNALIVIFAALAVPTVSASEGDKAGDINLWPERLIRAQDRAPRGRLESQIADCFRSQHRRERARQGIVADEAAAVGARVKEPTRVKRVSGFFVVCEGVPQHQRSIRRHVMVEFSGGFRFRARNWREPSRYFANRNVRKRAACERQVDGGCHCRVNVRVDLTAIVLLLGRHIVESPILHDGTAEGKASPKTSERRLLRFRLKWFRCVERAVLSENERVAMNCVGSGTRDDVNRPAGRSA